jgi:NAD(P)-dependent dehydrogenase (short-subunit alcohol dehydrogenase family)
MADSLKVALVTGAGSGIGRAVSHALMHDGYAVVLAGRRMEPLQETVDLAEADAARCLCVPTDVGKPQQVAELFAQAEQAFGRLDLLFNNAGSYTPGVPMEELSYEQWQATVDVNLTGPFLCAQQAIRIMKAQIPKGGRRLDFGACAAPFFRALYLDQARHYRPHQIDIAGLQKRQYRLRSDRYRQCRDADDAGDAEGRAAGQWRTRGGAGDGCGTCRRGGAADGLAAARHQRTVHDHHGDLDAVYRPRLSCQ